MKTGERRPIRRPRKPPARNLTRSWAQNLVQNEEKHDGYRNKTLGCSSSGDLVVVSCHWAGGAEWFVVSPFEQNGAAGKAKPKHGSFQPGAPHRPTEGQRDPQAEAVEAVEQPAEKTFAGKFPKAHQDFAGAVFPPQKMRRAPHGKTRDQ
jgi:hypothetical protein